jgi:hypothetical protein
METEVKITLSYREFMVHFRANSIFSSLLKARCGRETGDYKNCCLYTVFVLIVVFIIARFSAASCTVCYMNAISASLLSTHFPFGRVARYRIFNLKIHVIMHCK